MRPKLAKLEPRTSGTRTAEPAPQQAKATPPPPAESPAPIDPRRLAAEVALLDRARTALGSDAAAALAILDEYKHAFADGALTAEADVLAIEALIAHGERAAAAERAQTFLATYPRSPLTKRVKSLLARATP